MKDKNQEEFEFVEEKVCTGCKASKTLEEFHWANKSRGCRAAKCKYCESIRKKNWRKENTHLTKIYDESVRHRNRQVVLEYMLNHPCIICGEDDPIVLEFDHRDPDKKCFGISDACSRKKTVDVIKEEIKKCDVLCANCHRRKTAKQYGYYAYKVLNEGFKYNPNAYKEFKAEMVE